MKTHLQEITDGVGTKSRFDHEKRIVYDVVIHKRKSANDREYSDRAMSDVARIFENSKVYMDHRPVSPNGRRLVQPVKQYAGRVIGLSVDGDEVRAKEFRCYSKEHWNTVSVAEHDPAAFGFSIDADGDQKGKIVTSVVKANSVDIVSTPATTNGLFEESNMADMTVESLRKDYPAVVAEIEKPLNEKIIALETEIKVLNGGTSAGETKKDPPPPADGAAGAAPTQESIQILRRENAINRKLIGAGVTLTEDQILGLCDVKDDKRRDALLEGMIATAKIPANKPNSRPPAPRGGDKNIKESEQDEDKRPLKTQLREAILGK